MTQSKDDRLDATLSRTAIQSAGASTEKPGGIRSLIQARDWFIGLFLVAATLLAYQPAWNGKPIWDDDAHLTRPELRSINGLMRIWVEPGATQQYYPLVFSTFWVQQKLWGDSTLGYHLVNILLHTLSALLVFGILRTLTVRGAWLAAAIFALHPVHVESVAWMTELKNTLSGLLCLGAAFVYLRFDQSRNKWLFGLALGLFLLGLTAKTAIAPLPVAILIILWWKRGALNWKRDLRPMVPFFLGGLAAGLMTMTLERRLYGAEGSIFNFSFIERCLIAGRSVWFHLGKLVWPSNLTFMYSRWEISQTIWWQYLFPASAVFLLVVLWLLRQWSRGPLAAMLFFMAMLFPVLGFFNAYSFRFSLVNDHHQYLASLGIIALVSAGVVSQFSRRGLLDHPVSGVLCVSLLMTLAALTWRQSRMYSDVETLWRTTIARNPTCAMAYNNLGLLLLQDGKLETAIVNFQKAIELEPEGAEAHNNLGNALLQAQQVDEAIASFRNALEILPGAAIFHNNLGNALMQKRQVAEGIGQYEKAVQLSPTSALLANNLAWVLATNPETSLRNGARAVELAERAVHLSGGSDPIIFGTLAAAYAEAGRFDDAIANGEKARAMAMATGKLELAQTNARLLDLYRAHRAYVEGQEPNVLSPAESQVRDKTHP